MPEAKSLIAMWFKASQWYEMFCHDPEFMGSNFGQDELGGMQSKSDLTPKSDIFIR